MSVFYNIGFLIARRIMQPRLYSVALYQPDKNSAFNINNKKR